MKRGALAAVSVAAVVLLVVWYAALFRPQTNERRRLEERLAHIEQEEGNLRHQLSRLRRLAASGESQEAQLARLHDLIPPQPELAEFILAANDAAVRAGVRWVSVTPGPPAPAGGFTAIGVNIQVEGGFFPIVRYLRHLEDLGRLIVIDSLQLGAKAQAGAVPELTATMAARIFTSANAPPTAASPPAPAPAATGAQATTGSGG